MKVDTQEALAGADVREYRYSGAEVDNYIYFNCQNGATAETASSKCEKWRILGVFTDEESGEERVKIVRNAVLPLSTFPDTYLAENETTYKIKGSSSSSDYAYWNRDSSDKYSNDWVKGGLQYWLNSKGTADGYLKKLSTDAQALIADTKYYLGNVTYYQSGVNGGSNSEYGIKETANEAYANERNNQECSSSKTNGCLGGYIWPSNSDTWTGKIALMYPSDYGYSASSDYWTTKLGDGTFNGTGSETSWLQKTANHSITECLLSPTSFGAYGVTWWYTSGSLIHGSADNGIGVRPVLNLISQATISAGSGTEIDPYFVEKGE